MKTADDLLDDYGTEIAKLKSALQRIADLPLKTYPGKGDVNARARRIAVAALGGNPLKLKHAK